MEVVEEGRLVGGTRTLIGGFETVATGLNPEMEDLEARDGRGRGLAGFCATLRTAFVGPVSRMFDLGSERDPG